MEGSSPIQNVRLKEYEKVQSANVLSPWHFLGNIKEPYQIYNEIEHLLAFACQTWTQRIGGTATRYTKVQPEIVRVTVGIEKNSLPGKELNGGASTPRKANSCVGAGARGAATASAAAAQTAMMAAGIDMPARRVAGGVFQPTGPLQEFTAPAWLLAESPALAELLQCDRGHEAIGPIGRPAKLFPAIIMLLTLRWILRLHIALVEIAGARCSLQRLLLGILKDSSRAQPHPAYFSTEHLISSLRLKLGNAWPAFLAFVSWHEHTPADSNFGANGESRPRTPQAPVSARNSSLSLTRGGSSRAMAATVSEDEGKGGNAFLWQVVDDIFITWLAQQDSLDLPANDVMQELDFYGLERPVVQTGLEKLRMWVDTAGSPTQEKYTYAAQRQAHHLAMALELSTLWPEWRSNTEDMLEMARNIAGHPTTFNTAVRQRVACVLNGSTRAAMAASTGSVDIPPALPEDTDEKMISRFHAFSADPRDTGRILPQKIEKLRDTNAAWLVGHASRFMASADSWPGKAPGPQLFPFSTDGPFTKKVEISSSAQVVARKTLYLDGTPWKP